MRDFGPRALTPRDGWDWLMQAWQLMWRQPGLFVAVALFAPSGSALLLILPIWEWWLPPLGGWGTLIATVFCYGLRAQCDGYAGLRHRPRRPSPADSGIQAIT